MKVAIYCRLSEEDKDKTSEDSLSIQNQKNMLVQYALKEQWEIYHIYSDDDYTGADRKRPAFTQLLNDAEDKKFQVILCKTQSRFTRELELVERYIHGIFPALGIRFISIVDQVDSDNKSNKKSRQIHGLINEWYLEDLSDNIKAVLTSRRQQGFHIGAFPLYGYRKDPDQKGKLLIDSDSATVVRQIFSLYSEGMGMSGIARYLNDHHVPNPSAYKAQQGIRHLSNSGRYNHLWCYSTISNILSNEMYCGHMVQGKYRSLSYKTKNTVSCPPSQWIRVENTHEAIISPVLWAEVAHLREGKGRQYSPSSSHLFVGRVQCSHCGYRLHSTKSRGRRYLRCPNQRRSSDGCQGAFLSVATLEEIVLTAFHHLCEEYLDLSLLESPPPPTNQSHTVAFLTQEKQRLTGKLAQYEGYLQRLYLDKVTDVLTDRDFSSLLTSFHEEKAQLESQLESYQQEIAQITLPNEPCPPLDTQDYVKVERLTPKIVALLIDSIEVGKRAKGQPYPPIKIHWNF